jgi:hypothetical protein
MIRRYVGSHVFWVGVVFAFIAWWAWGMLQARAMMARGKTNGS